jgi:hypothetical protein
VGPSLRTRHRQEVTTVLTKFDERLSALPAVRAQESILLAAPAAARDRAGLPAVGGQDHDMALTQVSRVQTPPIRWVQGTTVFAVKNSGAVMDPVSGVRGKPPRGRPV